MTVLGWWWWRGMYDKINRMSLACRARESCFPCVYFHVKLDKKTGLNVAKKDGI